jgi:F-type H+-transporting ATPase subunit gamma
MSDSSAALRRKIGSAGELRSVVRTMKAVAAASITQYEKSVGALAEYQRSVELGLSACLRQAGSLAAAEHAAGTGTRVAAPGTMRSDGVGAIVFGSDQGLVGQFNDAVADCALSTLAKFPAGSQVWAVGERVQARLTDAGVAIAGVFEVPASVGAITTLVAQILQHTDTLSSRGDVPELYLFHNRPTAGAIYTPVSERLLPLDAAWHAALMRRRWPTRELPEVLGPAGTTLQALVGEYLFVSIFRACAESLASENASRLAAMQRAEKNIDELLVDMNANFHRMRQSSIDEELFDVVSGFEALSQ